MAINFFTFFFQAEDGLRDGRVTGVQTCALPIFNGSAPFTMADLGVISLAFGTVVVATVYALGHVGGNHINPAVTLGLAVTGKFPWAEVPAYIAAQVAGAIAGSGAILAVLGGKASDVGLGVANYGDISWTQAFAAEFIGTFVLVFTVFG